MSPPKIIKEVQCLNGRINALRWFISKIVEKCKPFFQLLKIASKGRVTWTMKCNRFFEDMKRHLALLPQLASPRLGEELLLYVATSEEAVSVVLVCERDQEQIPIYYHSKRLQGPKLCYLPIEKIVYAIIHVYQPFHAFFLHIQSKFWLSNPYEECFTSQTFQEGWSNGQ